MENLKEKTSKGLLWSALNNGSTQVLNLVFGIALARLLTPEDYGIIGVLTIFTTVAGALQASGFNTGLINLKSPTDHDYNSVFWFNVFASWGLYLILLGGAPFIAAFFNQPCLVSVSRIVFLSVPISAIGISNGAYMTKNMMNREMALLSIYSLVISGCVGIVMAFNDYGYWSLVAQQLTYTTISNFGRFFYVQWRPTLCFDFDPVRKMFNFCVKILFTHIAIILNQHLLTFVFGRLFPIQVVGNYFQASKWNTMAYSTIQNSIGQISQTVLVSVEEEREREIRVFRKLVRFTAFLCFPALFGLALVAKEFIFITIGEKWENSVPLLQILCLGGAFSPFYILYQHLIISKERSDLYLRGSVCQIVIQLASALALFRFGIITVVWGYSFINICWLFVWQSFANKVTGIRLKDVLKDILPFALISLGVMVVIWLCTSGITQIYILFPLRIVLAVLFYITIMKLLKVTILEECLKFFKLKKPTND